jgi:hypothetical protein
MTNRIAFVLLVAAVPLPRIVHAEPGAGAYAASGVLLAGKPVNNIHFRKNDVDCQGFLEVGPIDLTLYGSSSVDVDFFTGIYATVPPIGVGLMQEHKGTQSCATDADCGPDGNCSFGNVCAVAPAENNLNYTPDTTGWFAGKVTTTTELVEAQGGVVNNLDVRVYAGISKASVANLGAAQSSSIDFIEVGEFGDCTTGSSCVKIASLPFELYDRCPAGSASWCDDLYVASNQTLSVTQGHSGSVAMYLAGPWVQDAAVSATASVLCSNLTSAQLKFDPPKQTCSLDGCQDYIGVNLTVPSTTPAGNYQATVQVSDGASGVSHNLPITIVVSPYVPPPPPTNPPPPVCSCPKGFYCDATGTCQRNSTCKPGTCQ